MRSSSGWSTSSLRTGQGWKVIVPMCAAQATVATFSTQISVAVRPDGNVTSTSATKSGAPLGVRLE